MVSSDLLLAWYDRHRRTLPWRARPGEAPDPYRVWLSEIMLQQTTVAAVKPRYHRFLGQFPTIAALADAPAEAVMREWAGLGYYARARNLHACAQAVAAAGWPGTPDGLRALPGIGAYTAQAVGAIAFGWPGVPVDGNVERVFARVTAITEPFPAGKRLAAAAAAAAGATPGAAARPSDFAQALFDLGATVCTPRAPACALCPWRPACRAAALGIAADLPVRAAKRIRPERFGHVFCLLDAEGRMLLRRRPARGLLGGMPELPGSDWLAERPAFAPPVAADWTARGHIRHVFTHFSLTLTVWRAVLPAVASTPTLLAEAAGDTARGSLEGRDDRHHGRRPDWLIASGTIEAAGLPTVFLKAARLALAPRTIPQPVRDDTPAGRVPQA